MNLKLKLFSAIVLLHLLRAQTFGQTNIGFEASAAGAVSASNAVPGWTIQSASNTSVNGVCGSYTYNGWPSSVNEVSVVNTPIFNHTFIGTVNHSPFGGNKILQINDTNGTTNISQAKTSFVVTYTNDAIDFAFCGSWEGADYCCAQPFTKIAVLDCQGNTIAGKSFSLIPPSSQCTGSGGFNQSGMVSWLNWTLITMDLSALTGSCVTLVVTAGDCFLGGHHGQMYFDAQMRPSQLRNSLLPPGPINPVSFCAGSSQATITGPYGYTTYQWTSSNLSGPVYSTSPVLTINNPVPGATYSLLAMSNYNMVNFTYTLSATTVSLGGVGTNPSCATGSSGSATIQGVGSSLGYSYLWTNNSNSVVSTSSVLVNQQSGTYSYTISPASGSCGLYAGTVSIGSYSNTSLTNIQQPFCGGISYLTAGAGSNYQWYHGTTPISGNLGTSQHFTVNPAVNNDNYSVTFINSAGCKDSIYHQLISITPGPLNIAVNGKCLEVAGSSATITLPNNYNMGNKYFSVTSLTNTPAYSSTIVLSSGQSYSVSSLIGGGNYSVTAFDGLCTYNATFAVQAVNSDFSIYSSGNYTLCPGDNKWLSIIFPSSTPTGYYTFSWSPSALIATTNTISTVNIIPQIAIGTQSTLTFSATVTSTLYNCQLTRTIALTAINPDSPVFNFSPAPCPNMPFTIIASPPGGIFTGSNIYPNGQVPASPWGFYNFSYSTNTVGCKVTLQSGYFIKWPLSMHINGLKNICAGETLTASAMGAASYTWSTGALTPSVLLSPTSNTVYTIIGADSDGCTAVRTITILSAPKPTLTITGNIICGFPVTTTVYASGAESYHWHAGPYSNSIIVTPSMVAQQFTLSGFNSGFCETIELVTMILTPKPTITLTGKLHYCSGETILLEAGGADKYAWNNIPGGSFFSQVASSSQVLKVSGVNEPGSCISEKTVSITVNECVGFREIHKEENTVNLYPNPFSEKIKAEVNVNQFVDFYNAAGALIFSEELNSDHSEISTVLWPAGIYLCKVRGVSMTFRLIKN